MGLRLIHKQRIPYDAPFVMDDKASGFVGQGINFETLVANVQKFRRANEIPIGLGFESELEAAVCAKYPSECKETDINLPPKTAPRLRLKDVILGTKVMLSLIGARLVGNNPIVSEEEAARRANICAGCKFNVKYPLPCGGFCGELRDLVHSIVGNRKSHRDDELGACGICGCELKSSVWVVREIQFDPLPENLKNQFRGIEWCWKKAPLI